MRRNNGKDLEEEMKILFGELLSECGFTVHKNRIQKSGTQDGMDNEITIIDENFKRHSIHLECKDYTTKLSYSEAVVKIPQIITSYKPSLIIFISPHKPFSNPYNDTRLEDFYSEFKVPIEFLTPDNNIQELISLDEELYKKIYDKEIDFEVDKNKIIKDFKRFILSTKSLKKIIIKEEDKYNYLLDIKEIKNYIHRTISEPKHSNENNELYYILQNIQKYNLIDIVNKLTSNTNTTNGLVLLGNPGIGKTTELQQVANKIWMNRDDTSCIPYYRSLNTFLDSNQISDFLPNNWSKIPQLLVILDGIDEMSNIQGFKSRLEKFLTENKNNSNIKFLLSCRTNIYENSIKDISMFDCYYLNNILFSDAVSYLNKNYSIPETKISNLYGYSDRNDFFTNPYYLNLFGDYYRETGTIPKSKSNLVEKYIDKRLETDRVSKYKNKSYDKTLVTSLCKKVSLTMEAMQQNHIHEKYLNKVLGSEKLLFLECCFIEKMFCENNFKFEHRNLQEFFVAKTLSDLSYEQIISFIRIDGSINKTHPSWLNSLSYLINILDKNSDTYYKLIDWIKNNDYKILFKLDSNRIPNLLRIELFQNYYKTTCKEQTLWLSGHDSITKEISHFGNCLENIDFLLSEILEINNHRRARISAIELLVQMDISLRIQKVKKIFLELLSAPLSEIDFRFKHDILFKSKKGKLDKLPNFINDVIISLGDFDNHQVTSGVINLIEESSPEEFFNYIKDVTPKILDDTKRKFPKTDNLSTSSQIDTLKRILLDFNEIEHILFSLNTFIQNEYTYGFKDNDSDIKKIISKLIKIQNDDTNVYTYFLKYINKSLIIGKDLYKYRDILSRFFYETETLEKAFIQILSNNNINFNKKRRFLTNLTTENNIDLLISEYLKGNIENQEMLYFRNNLSNLNYKLSKTLQTKVLSKTPFEFNGDLLDDTLKSNWEIFYKEKEQNSFNLYFNKELILFRIKEYLSNIGKQSISYEDMKEDKKEYRDSIELQTKFPSSFMYILYDSLNENNGKTNLTKMTDLLNSDLYLINKIKENLPENNHSVILLDSQKNEIEKWCNINITKAVFHSACNCKTNQLRCHLLWYFRNKFDFEYPEDILLDMLFIDGKMKVNDHDNLGYNYIIEKVDKTKLNNRVANNLDSGFLDEELFKNHALYSLEHNLNSTYGLIRDFIIDESYSYYYRNKVLKSYIEKNNDIPLLKELVKLNPNEEYQDNLSWDTITKLQDVEEHPFVIDSLLEFKKINKVIKNEIKIIKYLINSNYQDVVKLFCDWIKTYPNEFKKEFHYSISSEDWKVYSNINAIDDVINLMGLENTIPNIHETSSPLRTASIIFKSISEKSTPETCLEILTKVREFERMNKTKKYDRYYINTMINDTEDIYYKHKSKPILFRDMIEKLKNIQYEIV